MSKQKPEDPIPLPDLPIGSDPAPKKTIRSTPPDIQALAAVDRILQKAEEKKRGTAIGILWFLCNSRGVKWAPDDEN